MKRLFSLIVAVLGISVLASFLLKLQNLPVFELAVLIVMVVLFLLSFTSKTNRITLLMLYGLSTANVSFLYLSSISFRTGELYLIGLLSLIGFFFELGRSEIIKIPVKEKVRLMRKWGMQKIPDISVEEELESAEELKKELKKAKSDIKKEIKESKKKPSGRKKK